MEVSAKHLAGRIKATSGATLIEFTLASVLIVGLIGAVFDLGLTFRNYSLLTYATSTVARQTSVKPPCGNAASGTEKVAYRYMDEKFGIKNGPTFHTEAAEAGDVGVDFKLVGTWELNCFFCLLSPKKLVLKSEGAVSIEGRGIGCS